MAERTRIRIEGTVQGVGFRPFVHRAATERGLVGFVRNDGRGALIEAEGPGDALDAFVEILASHPPALARVESISQETLAPRGEHGFRIEGSAEGGERSAPISPDAATCAACLAEILDPDDRRYRYPFTNCTACGPRFTIVTGVPYDRVATTMRDFAMCDDCAREYADPGDRRFHAQPVCCPACGPRLVLLGRDGKEEPGDPIAGAAARLAAGDVVAVKGLGGFHLAVAASDGDAVAALRARKHREERPLALLAPDLAWAERLVHLDDTGRRCLGGAAAPILLAARRADAPVAEGVAPGMRWLGVMLPYTPLHHLLSREIGAPLVLTSGNLSDEPIAFRDDDASERLAPLCDAWLTHDRPISVRCDDSVVRVHRGAVRQLRRSRGHAPGPLPLPFPAPAPILACGGELKSTICLAKGERAHLSQHLGDLENWAAFEAFREAIDHLARLVDVTPAVIACDLHPEYLSTKHARELAGADPALVLEVVQHHHAHAAACLAESGCEGPALAVCFDGLGYGSDGTIWGGELLVADLAGFERVGRLAPVPMPGAVAAIREPWRMAAAHLDAAYGDALPTGLAVVQRNREHWDAIGALLRSGVQAPATSSVGRLFDAVAALVGIRDRVSFEGQTAIALEQLADPTETGAYPMRVREGALLELEGADLIRAVVDDLGAGTPPDRIASRFHRGLARATAAACRRLRRARGLDVVALSGGVFQNQRLLELLTAHLEEDAFHVLTHSALPPNDGGLSYGQAVVAAARARH